jgi:hypothetical protein
MGFNWAFKGLIGGLCARDMKIKIEKGGNIA